MPGPAAVAPSRGCPAAVTWAHARTTAAARSNVTRHAVQVSFSLTGRTVRRNAFALGRLPRRRVVPSGNVTPRDTRHGRRAPADASLHSRRREPSWV